MKLLFDENLSPRLAQRLQSHFPDSIHVNDCGLGAASDDSIWTFARENGFVIVSKDADFQDLSVLRGDPPKVVWLRVGNSSTLQIQNLLEHARADSEAFARSGDAILIIRPK